MPFRFSEEEKKFLVFQILTGNRFHFSERFDFILIRSESETPTKLASVYGLVQRVLGLENEIKIIKMQVS